MLNSILPIKLFAADIHNNTVTITSSSITIPIELSGRISPLETYDLSAATSAQIAQVYIKLGQKVTKDQALLTLKSDQLEIDIRNAKESLIRAELDFNHKKSWKQSDDVFQAEQTLVKNKLTLQNSLDTYNQNQKLFSQGIIAKSELVQSKTNYQDAKVSLELSTRHLQEVIKQGNATQLNLMQLNLDNAKAKLAILEDIKAKLFVTAPIDGVILKPNNNSEKSNKNTNFLAIGASVNTGENLLAIGNLQGFTVSIAANEQIIQNIALDQKVNIAIPALANNNSYNGVITAIDAQPNNTENLNSPPMYNIKVSCLSSTQNNIYLGMTAKINFNLIEKPNTILIPFSSIAYQNNKPYVLKQNKLNQFKANYIELGKTTADRIEVLAGLQSGDVIKTSA